MSRSWPWGAPGFGLIESEGFRIKVARTPVKATELAELDAHHKLRADLAEPLFCHDRVIGSR